MKYFSLLDLAPIVQSGDAALAFRNCARSRAPSEDGGTIVSGRRSIITCRDRQRRDLRGDRACRRRNEKIRVGAGGIMLPNHVPLAIAEQFGTLEALFPAGSISGSGARAGSDRLTARALRRNLGSSGDTFPEDVLEPQTYFAPASPDQLLQAVPGAGASLLLYLLGSSDFSARHSGRTWSAFASPRISAPDYLEVALRLYRQNFKPSAALSQPHAIVGAGFSPPKDADAGSGSASSASAQLQFLSMVARPAGKLPPPVESMEGRSAVGKRAAVDSGRVVRRSGSGGPVRVELAVLARGDRGR